LKSNPNKVREQTRVGTELYAKDFTPAQRLIYK